MHVNYDSYTNDSVCDALLVCLSITFVVDLFANAYSLTTVIMNQGKYMNSILMNKSVPVIGQYDVIVCGGGPAGWIAAVAAARNGAKTALIERYGFLGGAATASLVTPISEFNKNGRRIIGGIPWEFVEKMDAEGAADITYRNGNIPYEPEMYKLVAQRMVLEAGVDLFLHSYIIDVHNEGKCVTHIIAVNKSGIQAMEGRIFIDATGDADVAYMAGVPMQKMPIADQLQPASMCLRLGGVDTDHLEGLYPSEENTKYRNERVRDILLSLPDNSVPPMGGPWFCTALRDGIVNVNITRRPADITDNRQVSETECSLREDAICFAELLRRYVPQFEKSFLIATGVQAGYRETRRIVGAHILTGEEYIRSEEFPDTVAKGAHPVDIHRAESIRQDVTFLKKEGNVPYRSLYSKEIMNLLVAGRCLSADEVASASTRVQASCMATGQAAGTAAALCCKMKCAVSEISVDLLRNTLTSQYAII